MHGFSIVSPFENIGIFKGSIRDGIGFFVRRRLGPERPTSPAFWPASGSLGLSVNSASGTKGQKSDGGDPRLTRLLPCGLYWLISRHELLSPVRSSSELVPALIEEPNPGPACRRGLPVKGACCTSDIKMEFVFTCVSMLLEVSSATE